MTQWGDRIRWIVDAYYDGSVYAASVGLDVSRGALRAQLAIGGTQSPRLGTIEHIAARTGLSVVWLATGQNPQPAAPRIPAKLLLEIQRHIPVGHIPRAIATLESFLD